VDPSFIRQAIAKIYNVMKKDTVKASNLGPHGNFGPHKNFGLHGNFGLFFFSEWLDSSCLIEQSTRANK
jgi:hypothetical protein